MDFTDRRDSRPGVGHGSRSFYAVATGRLGTEEKFVYLTLGYGNGRFNNRPFGGLSWPVCDKLTVFGEYDGFQTNYGIAFHPWERLEERNFNATFLFGMAHTDLPNVGVAFTYSP